MMEIGYEKYYDFFLFGSVEEALMNKTIKAPLPTPGSSSGTPGSPDGVAGGGAAAMAALPLDDDGEDEEEDSSEEDGGSRPRKPSPRTPVKTRLETERRFSEDKVRRFLLMYLQNLKMHFFLQKKV